MDSRGQGGDKGCNEHPNEDMKGFCKDCSAGVCFRCAIGKHKNHTIVNIDELDRRDLETQISVFENKIEQLREKALLILDKARNSESHSEKLPEITRNFTDIKEKF
jgi:hypothetical protein